MQKKEVAREKTNGISGYEYICTVQRYDIIRHNKSSCQLSHVMGRFHLTNCWPMFAEVVNSFHEKQQIYKPVDLLFSGEV